MHVGRTPLLLERETELEELWMALEDARSGNGRAVIVEGVAGIGKTALLESARESANRTGMRALSARGTELERDFPFAIVRQLFEPVVHALRPAERDQLLDDAARLAGPLVGIEPRRSATDPEHLAGASFEILNALYWLTSNLAQQEPLLIVVDDGHWSDQASLRFLMFLLPRLGALPVALAVSTRDGELDAESELLAQLSADPAARMLRPAALGMDSVATLVRAEFGAEAEDAFCAACNEGTGGNPFLLQELLLELRAEQRQGVEAEAATVHRLAPRSIRRAVLARLARLRDDCRALARAIAVLGDDAEPQQAGALAGIDGTAAARAADALAAAGILEAGRLLRFAHPLLRNAVYADLPGAEKLALHRMAADLLEAGGAGPERIAVHLLATDPRGDGRVVETLSAAARRALEHGAPESAVAYLRRALIEPPRPSARSDLLRLLMTASLFSMDASLLSVDQEALEGLQMDPISELTAEPQGLFAAAAELAPLLHISGRREAGVALLESATAAAIEAEEYDLVMRFQAQIVLWGWLPPGPETGRWEPHEGRIAPGTPGERLLLTMKAYTGYGTDESASRVAELARRAVEGGAIFREQRDLLISAVTVLMLIRADDLDAAERAIEDYSRAAETRGPAPTIASAWMRGELAYARGQIARAEPYARAAVEVARQRGFLVGPACLWLALLIDVLIERDALDAAEHELETSGFGDGSPIIYASPLKHSRGCLFLTQGRTAEGLKDLLAVADRGKRLGFKNPVLPTGAVAAIALSAAGEDEAARAAAESYRCSAELWGTPRVKGIAQHCEAVVKGGDRGIQLLREAVATLRRSPARLELARALTDLGGALRRANHRAEARAPLREALDIARRDGALAVARRAHEELEATGERLRPLLASGVESLTPSERRVAALAAEGKTNRAIAQELFLTVKTIEAHLSSVYRKLDIGSRSELPDALGVEFRDAAVPSRL
jgi:DNA-binding CsgD family transcriptional regulator